jgi:hypothetical protein
VFSLFAALLVILALYAMYSMNSQAVEKVKLQNTADAAAYSAAVAEARDYNFSAYTNRAMVANQVAVAQFVGLTSWFRNMSAFANNNVGNPGRTVYQLFFDIFQSPLGNVYMKFLKGFGKVVGIFDENQPGSTFMKAAVTVLDALIRVYGETQRIYHYATALTIAQTLGGFSAIGDAMSRLTGVDWFSDLAPPGGFLDTGNVIHMNDPEAGLTVAGIPYVIYHLYEWYKFTERKDPNNAPVDTGPSKTPGDGPEADRFAQVTMDSLDDFSRDRSTKPAWGFDFIYAPPLTFIDPTRFIPYQNGPLFMPVIHRGGTELKLTDSGGGGGTAGGNPDGNSGVDCKGNATSANGTGTKVGHVSDLPTDACPGDSVTVTDNNDPAKEPPGPAAGVYTYTGTVWKKASPYVKTDPPSNPQNPQGSSGQHTTSTSSTAGRGMTGTKNKRTWTAMDASSWAGLDIVWFSILGIPIPLPVPFAPPWMPLSHGAAQSGQELATPTVLATDNNFGVESKDAYGGTVSSWTTKLSAEMRQNKGAGKSLTAFNTQLGGLTRYMDVADVTAENKVGPPLVIEIERSTDSMPKSPGTGRFALENGAPATSMRVLSKAEVYFERPTSDTALEWFKRTVGAADQGELGSLYNPYWQPRLAPNTFIEQYLSMELHRAGL